METRTYLVVINLFSDDRAKSSFAETLGGVRNGLQAMCSSISGPIFNSKDARDFALFVRTSYSADRLRQNLESGCHETQNVSPLAMGDSVLICEVGKDCAARGFANVWKFLFEHRRESGF